MKKIFFLVLLLPFLARAQSPTNPTGPIQSTLYKDASGSFWTYIGGGKWFEQVPLQTGQNGKVLGTNGTTLSWVTGGGGGGTTTYPLTNGYGINTFSFNGGTNNVYVIADTTVLTSQIRLATNLTGYVKIASPQLTTSSTLGYVWTATNTSGAGSWQAATGSVTSVTAANTGMTISPTTGAVVVGINYANVNSWTARQIGVVNNITTAPTTTQKAWEAFNSTAATNSHNEASPSLAVTGATWSGSASIPITFGWWMSPINASSGKIVLSSLVNAAYTTNIFSIDNLGNVVATGNINAAGSIVVGAGSGFSSSSTSTNNFNGQSTMQTATGTAGTDSVMVKHAGGVIEAISATYYSTGGGSTTYSLTAGSTLTASTGSSPWNGSAAATYDINLANANTWSALQTFGTNISIGGVQPIGATGTANIVFSKGATLTGTTTINSATGTAGTDSVMVKHNGGIVDAISPTYYATTSSLSGYVPTSTTVAGFALSGNITLANHTPGYGLVGSAYNGSTAQALTADTASSTALVSKGRLATNLGGYSLLAGSSSLTTIGTIGSSPYTTAGVIHNSVTTGAFTSSLIVNADITAGTIAAAKLVGTDIATVGIITSGTWNGTAITNAYLANSGNNDYRALQELGSTYLGYTPGNVIMNQNNGIVLTSGTLIFQAVYVPVAATLTGVKVFMNTEGSYTSTGYNGVGLYTINNTTGTMTLVASSTTSATVWQSVGFGLLTIPFSSTYAATEGTYYVAFLWQSSATTTAPKLYMTNTSGTIVTYDFAHSIKLQGTVAGTVLPTPTEASSSLTTTSNAPYTYLY